ncbi:RNA polymerase factor sigma-54 [Candidatus Phycosocius spiralis]|uniref:RNA polymerase sigma-54 factor n=1 Tax=Candidatus Phycosocius spiralis TaxID=2815099 RepID=A0ABQ4PU04_9PROT|nr:RNA polymerase factor sigma-54 [Candidatus Phycosocius spiralis]GIU66441.1 RNA polymerase sigma-54 factor [Candidatus Phycosocius spiralis]
MAIAPRMELRQGQGLVMTPQLQQAIKLLQMSSLELAAYLEQELERNPILDRLEEVDDYGIADLNGTDPREAITESEGPQELGAYGDGPNPYAEAALDASYDDVHTDADMPASEAIGANVDWSQAGGGHRGFDQLEDVENWLTKTVSLHDHLDSQATLAFSNPADRLVAGYLIDHVDEGGYLRADLDEVSERLGFDRQALERIVSTLQTFEPTGVCARSIEECLAAQLKERDRYDPAMQVLVANLALLARHDLKSLYDLCGVDGADLADMIGEIRALSPKPGAAYSTQSSSAVIPDIFVREGPHGTWLIELNTDHLPRVLVNHAYAERVSRSARSEEERSYLAEVHSDATWLVKSLDQRARTILKVAKEIVRQQDGFLTYGVAHLRPLILKDVASVIDMHESTVSRVTSNKFISTPRGVFELKYFFTTALHASDGGESHSAEAVRHQIKCLIEGEVQAEPLSDDRIVEILRETGVDIARRTVAKYRETLRIPSSVQRRRASHRAG